MSLSSKNKVEQRSDTCFKQYPPIPGRKLYDVPMEVARILEQADELSPDNFEILCLELMKKGKLSKPQIVKLKNLIISEERRSKKGTPVATATEVDRSGHPSMVDPGLSRSPGLNLPAPVTKVPLIVRMDLAAAADVLALDTEKVINTLHQPVSGDIALVDKKGRLVFWAHIMRQKRDVCRLNTVHTGLTQAKLEMGIPEELMKSTLEMVIKGKTIVGAKLKDDFISLGFKKRIELPKGVKLLELQDFFRDESGDPIKLSQLALHFVGSNPQDGAHSSLRDARLTMICYRRMLRFKENGMTHYHCERFDEFRQAEKLATKKKQKWEPCHCGLAKKKIPKLSIPVANWLDGFGDPDITFFE